MSGDSKTIKVRKTGQLSGSVKAPASKSYTHRAIMVAALDGTHRVVNPLLCDDTRATVGIWRKLGVDICRVGKDFAVKGCGGRPRIEGHVVNANESGTLLRFILPLLALAKGSIEVRGRGTLKTRTNRQIVDVLRSWGVDIAGRGDEHFLPISINADGILRGGRGEIDAGVTSQVVSALLIAAPFARRDTVLKLSQKLVSRPYVDVTVDVLKWAGVTVDKKGSREYRVRKNQRLKPQGDYIVHGDYSSAAFLLSAAALCEGEVTVTDLVNDCQGDRKIINILRRMGAKITRRGDSVTVQGAAKLVGIEIDGSDTPDLVPILSTVACFAKGTTRIKNVAHLVHKESNRLAKPTGELRKLGARISFTTDELVIRGSKLHGAKVSSCSDHRIAMSLAVAGLRTGGVTITGAESISKSYPGFCSDMKKLGAQIKVV